MSYGDPSRLPSAKSAPEILDAIADLALAYRPKEKRKKARKRKPRKATKKPASQPVES